MSNGNNFQKVKLAVAFSISILSFLFLIPIVVSIHIPLERTNSGIVSLASTTTTSPYTNYVKFLILLSVPSLIGIIVLNIKQELISKYWQTVTNITREPLVLFCDTGFYTALTFILILLWAVNKNYDYLNWILTDTFHEGEYLGFLPNFLTLENPFLRSFMIHGFGLDVWASLMASKVSNYTSTNIIALTRFFRMSQGLIGYLSCYWIIWELVSSIKLNISRRTIFLLSSIVFTVLDGAYYRYFTGVFTGRDTFFIFQLALTIRFFRIVNISKSRKIEKLLLPILVGASLPVSFIYVYDRAAYFLLVYLFVCTLSICFGRSFVSSFLIKSIFGSTISLLLILVVLGFKQTSEILSQVLFWIHYGRYISFNPLPSDASSLFAWIDFAPATLTLIFTVLYLKVTYEKVAHLNIFLRNNSLLLILLFSSLMYMRIAIDRPNSSDYVGSGSLISALLLIYLSLNVLINYFQGQIDQLVILPIARQLTVTFTILFVLLHQVLNPFTSLEKLVRVHTSYKTPDAAIVRPDLIQAYEKLKPEVNQSSCFFTLTQEGFWYYLFKKPSCSKFGVLFYARTIKAQETVIREVNTQKPNIILFSSTTRSSTFDGIQTADAVPIIYRYFLKHYHPYTLEASQWFWQRNDKKLVFTKDKSQRYFGRIDTVLGERVLRGTPVSLTGVAGFGDLSKTAEAVYISYGEDNQLIEVTKVDKDAKWAVPIPTISLPLGKSLIRVWSYATGSSQLVQISEDIKIDLVNEFSQDTI